MTRSELSPEECLLISWYQTSDVSAEDGTFLLGAMPVKGLLIVTGDLKTGIHRGDQRTCFERLVPV